MQGISITENVFECKELHNDYFRILLVCVNNHVPVTHMRIAAMLKMLSYITHF